jgi:hypothetical protein
VFRDDQGIGVLETGSSGSAGFLPERVTSVSGLNGGGQPVALGDLDGDGWLDVLTAEYPGCYLGAFLNDGDGGLQPEILSLIGGVGSTLNPVLGDFNGDGLLEVGVWGGVGIPGLAIYPANLGGGSFADVVLFPKSDCGVSNGLWAGPSGGTLPMLASGCTALDAVSTFSSLTNTDFSSARTYAVPQPTAIRGGDINGDGWTDLVSLGTDRAGGGATLSLLLGLSDGGMLPASSTSIDPSAAFGYAPLTLGNFHGGSSASLDVAVLNGGQTFTVWLNGCP